MHRTALDMYDDMPKSMMVYLRNYGMHFNKKACDFAVSLMKTSDGVERERKKKLTPISKEEVEQLLKNFNINIDNDVMYDKVYVANKCKANYMMSSITDDHHMALYIKDTLDDVDAVDGQVFNEWYADMVRSGMPIEWEELL